MVQLRALAALLREPGFGFQHPQESSRGSDITFCHIFSIQTYTQTKMHACMHTKKDTKTDLRLSGLIHHQTLNGSEVKALAAQAWYLSAILRTCVKAEGKNGLHKGVL